MSTILRCPLCNHESGGPVDYQEHLGTAHGLRDDVGTDSVSDLEASPLASTPEPAAAPLDEPPKPARSWPPRFDESPPSGDQPLDDLPSAADAPDDDAPDLPAPGVEAPAASAAEPDAGTEWPPRMGATPAAETSSTPTTDEEWPPRRGVSADDGLEASEGDGEDDDEPAAPWHLPKVVVTAAKVVVAVGVVGGGVIASGVLDEEEPAPVAVTAAGPSLGDDRPSAPPAGSPVTTDDDFAIERLDVRADGAGDFKATAAVRNVGAAPRSAKLTVHLYAAGQHVGAVSGRVIDLAPGAGAEVVLSSDAEHREGVDTWVLVVGG